MKYTKDNIMRLLFVMMKDKLELSKHFEEEGNEGMACHYRGEMMGLQTALFAIDDKEMFAKYCDIYDCRE